MILFFTPSLCITCSNSALSNTVIYTQVDNFTSYTQSSTYAVASSPASNNLYFLYQITLSGNQYASVRKVNSSNTEIWSVRVDLNPVRKSLTVDISEQNVYIAFRYNPVDIVKLKTLDGSVTDAQRFSSIDGSNDDIRIHLLSDNSGYYIIGKNTKAVI